MLNCLQIWDIQEGLVKLLKSDKIALETFKRIMKSLDELDCIVYKLENSKPRA